MSLLIDSQWSSPLLLATAHAPQPDDVIRLLAANGAQLNVVGIGQKMALHYASSRGLGVEKLLEGGAIVNAADKGLWKAFNFNSTNQLQKKQLNLIATDISNNLCLLPPEGDTCLHLAARENHWKSISHLLRHGADPNIRNMDGKTALHLASASGAFTSVTTLTEGGTNLLITDNDSHLAMYHAAKYGHLKIVRYFIKRNVPLSSCRNHLGKIVLLSNPLSVALREAHLAAARVLVMAGCDTKPLHDWLIDVPRDVSDVYYNGPYVDWLENWIHQPIRLAHACRLTIRTCLGVYDVGKFNKCLPLPIVLKKYLMFEDIESDADMIHS